MTVVDPLADIHLPVSSTGSGKLANKAAEAKVAKYRNTEVAMRAVHLPSAVEVMGGLSESAQRPIREIHHTAQQQHCTWREADAIGGHLVDSVAIAVQHWTGRALRASEEEERGAAMGVEA